jgi:hypothetical protein
MPTVCKRCLLKELTGSEYFAGIYEYIENLPAEMKADPVVYEQRLSACRACDSLVNGMCRLCGCFVEARASKKSNHCAKSRDVWR